ncbi:hypothetical protein ACN47E_004929 [Coniothyrium glycines]
MDMNFMGYDPTQFPLAGHPTQGQHYVPQPTYHGVMPQVPNIHFSPNVPTNDSQFLPPAKKPMAPLDLQKPSFASAVQAQEYLRTPIWRPKSGSYGVPRAAKERMVYVKLIYDGLINLDHVLDFTEWPEDAFKFNADTGEWSNAQDIEAIAHKVVDVAISIHDHGITGLQFARQPGLKTFAPNDQLFTFQERIYLMHLLIKHYKFVANLVMRQEFIEQYLARIWSSLMERAGFSHFWSNIDKAAQLHMLHVRPYKGTGVVAPPDAERQRWKTIEDGRFPVQEPAAEDIKPVPEMQQETIDPKDLFLGGLDGDVIDFDTYFELEEDPFMDRVNGKI